MLKEHYSLRFRYFRQIPLWEFCVGDVASEDLNVASVNLRLRHEVKGPRARPGANINNSGDVSNVYPRGDNLGMADHALNKWVLSVQPV